MDTYEAAEESLEAYSEKLEHNNKLLEHQEQLLSLTGRATDYKAIGVVLEGQTKLAENNLKISKKQLLLYQDEVKALNLKMQEAANNPELFALYQQ
jgi:hypothetical protein